MRNLLLVAAFLVSALDLAACLPSAKPVTTNWVVLAGRTPTAAPGNPTIILGIARVNLPGYLDRGELATRSGASIVYSPTERWAEPLSQSVPRLLAEDLSAALGPAGIAVSPQAMGDIALVVTIERFELDGSGRCVLDARYVLRDMASDRIVKIGAARYEETPTAATGNATALALAKALERMAGDVVSGVTEARAAATR